MAYKNKSTERFLARVKELKKKQRKIKGTLGKTPRPKAKRIPLIPVPKAKRTSIMRDVPGARVKKVRTSAAHEWARKQGKKKGEYSGPLTRESLGSATTRVKALGALTKNLRPRVTKIKEGKRKYMAPLGDFDPGLAKALAKRGSTKPRKLKGKKKKKLRPSRAGYSLRSI